MNDEWFLYAGEETIGPYAAEQLRAMLTAGELTPESYVRRSDEDWRMIGDALSPSAGTTTEAAPIASATAEAPTEYTLAVDPEDEETELELAKEQPSVVAEEEEADYAIQTNDAGDARPMIVVGAAPTKTSGSASSFAVSSGGVKRPSAVPARRSKNPAWMKNKNAMLIAAIVAGALAAILVGKLVLWLVRPAPKPVDPYDYGARPAPIVTRSAT